MEHPNRAPFTGILGYVDEMSEASPSGARGRRVMITKKAADEALHTLIGMGVNFSATWDNHDMRRVAGIITDALIVDNRIDINGYIFAVNFPDLIRKLEKESKTLGMSYELKDAHVLDMRKSEWVIEKLTFTGAAIQLREKCAYRRTSIELNSHIIPSVAAIGTWFTGRQ